MAYGAASPTIGVAEFAPAARQDLSSPPTTADSSSKGAGARGRRATTTTTTAPSTASASTEPSAAGSGPTTKVARARTCVGNPPRQTDDPQSPACVATIFEGDNSGATSMGVTGAEIAVAVPVTGNAAELPLARAMFEHFNQKFEFYGRRLVPVFVTASANNPMESRALGADIAGQRVFAALPVVLERFSYPQEALYQELARNGVITVLRGAGKLLTDRQLFDQYHPFVWSVYPSSESVQRNVASFVCRALVGHLAQHAADTSLQATTRKFGIVAYGQAKLPGIQTLAAALDDCGAARQSISVVYLDDPSSTSLRSGLEALKAGGVTSLLCVCEGGLWAPVYSMLPTLNFKPEWLTVSTRNTNGEEETYFQSYTGMPAFGVMEQPKLLPYQAQDWFRALQQYDAALSGDQSALSQISRIGPGLYHSLLLLSSGIQAAGPVLTPATFGAGLMSASFANPGAGQAPFWQPSVGFGPGDHSFYNDFALAWWNSSADPVGYGSQPGRGSWCYLDQGARWAAGEYPADADGRLFDTSGPCR